MGQTVFFDGNTSLGSYSHVNRRLELSGLPMGGWTKVEGFGMAVEGQTHVIGAGGIIRGMSDGIPKPKEGSITWEAASWELLVISLNAEANATGDFGPAPYTRVDLQIVDQWAPSNPLGQPITITMTVRVKEDTPEMPETGENGTVKVTYVQTTLATRTMG